MSATVQGPRRADAVRNREAVIRAAAEVFAEKGLEAGVPEVAARAGVGKATVYRSFPSKEHLIAAVAIDRLEWVAEVALDGLSHRDAGAGLEQVVVTIAERAATDCSLTGSMAADIHLPELVAARAAVHEGLDALVARGRRQGALRRDATSEDLRVLYTGFASVLRGSDERDPRVWRRYATLVVDALRS
jgi:AcrR family transcriptional regulator